jgi:hypothetical protein
MRTEGANFLQKNSARAEEVRRTFVDLDEVEKELKKAAKSIEAASGLTLKYTNAFNTVQTMPPSLSRQVARRPSRCALRTVGQWQDNSCESARKFLRAGAALLLPRPAVGGVLDAA